ncbi:MAG: wax ester/triacylglycerol synthase family O-acyltransferase, partial [Actinomycetota bacterium]|nr:wax ester/triacylglycerol synthase family O-acyltransferase [Actinomycetota bacterium]
MSVLDASFLYLERSNVHMHVAGIAVLDPSTAPNGRIDPDMLATLVGDRIHMVPRFRQKVVTPPFGVGRPLWVDDPDFDVGFHLRRAALPKPGGQRELAEFVQRVHSRPLDRSKPLWEMYTIEGLEDGYTAVLFKSHHAMTDGVSGIDIATVMVDFEPEPRRFEAQRWAPEPAPSPAELLADSIRDSVTHPVRSLMDGLGRIARTPAEVWDQAKDIVGGTGEILARGTAPASPFNRTIGPNRRLSLAEFPLAEAKAVKDALGGTVNDVVLTAVSGSLRHWYRHRGLDPTGTSLRAMVPVSTRDTSQQMALGNQVSMFFVDLPIGIDDAAQRLERIKELTAELKSSHQAMAATAIMGTAQWAPPTLHALAARLIGRSRFANLVVSNVPGPQIPLYIGGARLVAAYPVMPLAPRIGLSVAVTSLAGTM